MSQNDYISTPVAAENWGVTSQTVRNWVEDDHIPGAIKVAGRWLIPADSERPDLPKGRPANV